MNDSQKVAGFLYETGAVSTVQTANKADWYTATSGIKLPLYCDNRRISSFLVARTFIYQQLASLVTSSFPTVDYLFATATGGMIPASFVAMELNLPLGYVRGGAKKHGLSKQIEGVVPNKSQIVVVEDLVTTGGSLCHVVDTLREAGYCVIGAVAIFTYNLQRMHHLLQTHDLRFHYLCKWDDFALVTDITIGQQFIDDLNTQFQKEQSNDQQ